MGLALARRAWELAPPGMIGPIGDTYAHAYFALGLDREAAEAIELALETVADEHRRKLVAYTKVLRAQIEKAGSPEGLRAAEEELRVLHQERDALVRYLSGPKCNLFDGWLPLLSVCPSLSPTDPSCPCV